MINTFCLLLFLVTACRHTQPERLRRIEPEGGTPTAEIRQHIAGEWTCDDSYGCWYPKLIIAEDGGLSGVEVDGEKVFLGTWELCGKLMRVTPAHSKIEAARRAGQHLNDWDYYPVAYADAHKLVIAPGISVAGRWIYKK